MKRFYLKPSKTNFLLFFRLKLFSKGIDSGVKYKGPRDIASFDKFIHEQLGLAYEVSFLFFYMCVEGHSLFETSTRSNHI